MQGNISKIKYLSVADKIYEVTSIDWQHLYLEARETDLNVGDVPESELWDISDFDNEFSIRLINNYGDSGGRMGEIIAFGELVERRKGEKGEEYAK